MQLSETQRIKQRFGIIGNAPALNRAIDIAVQVSSTDLSVLITGESGVGKETFPQIIHQYSPRKHNAYIAGELRPIPKELLTRNRSGTKKVLLPVPHPTAKAILK